MGSSSVTGIPPKLSTIREDRSHATRVRGSRPVTDPARPIYAWLLAACGVGGLLAGFAFDIWRGLRTFSAET